MNVLLGSVLLHRCVCSWRWKPTELSCHSASCHGSSAGLVQLRVASVVKLLKHVHCCTSHVLTVVLVAGEACWLLRLGRSSNHSAALKVGQHACMVGT